MKNKKAKQMICDVCKFKMENADSGNVYDFAYFDGYLGFWVNRIGRITKAPKFGVVSLTANQLRGK